MTEPTGSTAPPARADGRGTNELAGRAGVRDKGAISEAEFHQAESKALT